MADVIDKLAEGLANAGMMAWEVWWALVLGFAISGAVQAWVPRERIEAALSGGGAVPVAKATGLGAASSSCSYAAIAIAKSLFAKGASAASALAFQFASTNLVWELGLVLWILIGWQFTLAEYLGGDDHDRADGCGAAAVRQPPPGGGRAPPRPGGGRQATSTTWPARSLSLRQRLVSADAWSDVAHNFRGDWQMLWKEITIGFLLAGYIALLGEDFFNDVFLTGESGLLPTLWNVIAGPLIAMASFVCSIGNVPLAAVLWSGGISFAGVMAFIFADLIVIPIILAYRKYYGWAFALRITALMFVTMVIAALIIDGIFSGLDLIPSTRPSTEDVFSPIELNYKAALNAVATVGFVALMYLTVRRGATDPVCGMKVDRDKAVTLERDGRTIYFCSEHCRDGFESHPELYQGDAEQPAPAPVS